MFWNNTEISNFIKICPVRIELLHADVWTDMMKQIVASRNFTNTPQKIPHGY